MTDIEMNKVLDAYAEFEKRLIDETPSAEGSMHVAAQSFIAGWRACIQEYEKSGVPSADALFTSRMARWLAEQDDKTLVMFTDLIRQARGLNHDGTPMYGRERKP